MLVEILPLSLCLRYLPSTVNNVTVIEGKVTRLNFILKHLSEELLMPGLSTTPVPTVAYRSTEQVLDNQQSSTWEPPVQRQDVNHSNYSQMEVFLQQISSSYSSLSQLYSIGQSVLGRDLYVMKISSDLGTDEPGSPLEGICLCIISVFNGCWAI